MSVSVIEAVTLIVFAPELLLSAVVMAAQSTLRGDVERAQDDPGFQTFQTQGAIFLPSKRLRERIVS